MHLAKRRQVRVHALAAPYARCVPVAKDLAHQVVLEPDDATVEAYRLINKLGDSPPKSDNVGLPLAKGLSNADEQSVLQDLKARVSGVRPAAAAAVPSASVLEAVDRPDVVLRLARVARSVSVVAAAPADTPGASRGERPTGHAAGTAAEVECDVLRKVRMPPTECDSRSGRFRTRRGGMVGVANTGVRGGVAAGSATKMAGVVENSPGTLGLSQRIALAALHNALNRELTVDEYRHSAIKTILDELPDIYNDYGHVAHLPPLNDPEQWRECAYEVTLRWKTSARPEDAGPDPVTLEVTHLVGAEGRTGHHVAGQPWMPCVALVENGGTLLKKMLEAFEIEHPDDVDRKLSELLAEKAYPAPPGEPARSITIGAGEFEVGVGRAPPQDVADVLNKVRQFNAFVPRPDLDSVPEIDTTTNGSETAVRFQMYTCTLLAATLWPLAYADADMAVPDNAINRAIEDYGDLTIAHSMTMSEKWAIMDDATFSGGMALTLTTVSTEGTKLMALAHSGAQTLFDVGQSTRIDDAPKYVKELSDAIESLNDAAHEARSALRRPFDLQQGAGISYHPATWGLATPLESIIKLTRSMKTLALRDPYGEGLAFREFEALRCQMGLDLSRFNTIYLGAPIWTPVRDGLSDLYEAAINADPTSAEAMIGQARNLKADADGAGGREAEEEESDPPPGQDPQNDSSPRAAFKRRRKAMAERAESFGFRFRAADQIESRAHMVRRASTRPGGETALASLATGLGANAMPSSEDLVKPILAAIEKISLTRTIVQNSPEMSMASAWDAEVQLALPDVLGSLDVVCAAMSRSTLDTMVRTRDSGRTCSEQLEATGTACAILQSAVLDMHRAAKNFTRAQARAQGINFELTTDDGEGRYYRSWHCERMLDVVQGKLAVAYGRIAPGADVPVGTSDAIRQLLQNDAAEFEAPGPRAILEAFRRAAPGDSLKETISATAFSTAFASIDLSERNNMVVDAAVMLTAAIHHSVVGTADEFDFSEAEFALRSGATRDALRRCPPDEKLVDCVSGVLDSLDGALAGKEGGKPRRIGQMFRPAKIAQVLGDVCNIAPSVCEKWLALYGGVLDPVDASVPLLPADGGGNAGGVAVVDAHGGRFVVMVARRAANGLHDFARRFGVRLSVRATRREAMMLLASAACVTMLGLQAVPTDLEEDLRRAAESPSEEEPPIGEEWREEQTEQPRWFGPRLFGPDPSVTRTYPVEPPLAPTPEDPRPPTVTYAPPMAAPPRVAILPHALSNSQPVDDVGLDATITPQATAHLNMMVPHNAPGADWVLKGMRAPHALDRPLAYHVRRALASAATAERFREEAEVVDTAAWVETANMTDACDLRELGGFNTTYVSGMRVVHGEVHGPTSGTTEFVVARARADAGEAAVADVDAFRIALNLALATLNMEEANTPPGRGFDEFARRAGEHGVVPIGYGTRHQTRGVHHVIAFERTRFHAVMQARTASSGAIRVGRGARSLLQLMYSSRQIDSAQAVHADGSPVDDSQASFEAALQAPRGESPADPTPPPPEVPFDLPRIQGESGGWYQRPGNMDPGYLAELAAWKVEREQFELDASRATGPLTTMRPSMFQSLVPSAPRAPGAPPNVTMLLRIPPQPRAPPRALASAAVMNLLGHSPGTMAPIGAPATVAPAEGHHAQFRNLIRGGDPSANDPMRIVDASKDFDSSIRAPPGRACHEMASKALRAAVGRTLREHSAARDRVTARVADRSTLHAQAHLVPGTFALQHDMQHYYFCARAHVDALQSLGAKLDSGSWAWDDAAVAIMGLPPVLEAPSEPVDPAMDDLVPNLEDVDAAAHEPTLDAHVDGRTGDPGDRPLADAAPTAPMATAAGEGVPATFTSKGLEGDMGWTVRKAILVEGLARTGISTLSILLAGFFSPYSEHLSGGMMHAVLAENARQFIITGWAAYGGVVMSSRGTLNAALNASEQAADEEEKADGPFDDLNMGSMREELVRDVVNRTKLSLVCEEVRRQVAWQASSIFFLLDFYGGMAYGRVTGNVWEPSGLWHRVVKYGIMSDMLRGADFFRDDVNDDTDERRPLGDYLVGTLLDLALGQLAIAGGSVTTELISKSKKTKTGSLPTADLQLYVGPFDVLTNWIFVPLGVIYAVGVLTSRWSRAASNAVGIMTRQAASAETRRAGETIRLLNLVGQGGGMVANVQMVFGVLTGILCVPGNPLLHAARAYATSGGSTLSAASAYSGSDGYVEKVAGNFHMGMYMMHGAAVSSMSAWLGNMLMQKTIGARKANEEYVFDMHALLRMTTIVMTTIASSGPVGLTGAIMPAVVGTAITGSATFLAGHGFTHLGATLIGNLWGKSVFQDGSYISSAVGQVVISTAAGVVAVPAAATIDALLSRQTCIRRTRFAVKLGAGAAVFQQAISVLGTENKKGAKNQLYPKTAWERRVHALCVTAILMQQFRVGSQAWDGVSRWCNWLDGEHALIPRDDRTRQLFDYYRRLIASPGRSILNKLLVVGAAAAVAKVYLDVQMHNEVDGEALHQLYSDDLNKLNETTGKVQVDQWMKCILVVNGLQGAIGLLRNLYSSSSAKEATRASIGFRVQQARPTIDLKALKPDKSEWKALGSEGVGPDKLPVDTLQERIAEIVSEFSNDARVEAVVERMHRRLFDNYDIRVHRAMLDPLDTAANEALAEAAARTHCARLPSPLMEVTTLPGMAQVAWHEMQGALAALVPPEQLLDDAAANGTTLAVETERAISGTLSANTLPQGGWFDAWLGYEEKAERHEEARNNAEQADDAYVRMCDGSNGMNFLSATKSNRARPLGDFVSAFPRDAHGGMREMGTMQLSDKEDVVGKLTGAADADALRPELAVLGFALLPDQSGDLPAFSIVNTFKKLLHELLPHAKAQAAKSHVAVWRHRQSAVKRASGAAAKEVHEARRRVALCQGMVAECTHRLVACEALRNGVDTIDGRWFADRFKGAIKEVGQKYLSIRFGESGETKLQTADQVHYRITAMIAASFVGNDDIKFEFDAEDSLDKRVAKLMARMTSLAQETAFKVRGEYGLVMPMQVARIDAALVHAAKLGNAMPRVQLPAAQAAEYGCVSALREARGMDAGIDARAHWKAVDLACKEFEGVIVRQGRAMVSDDDTTKAEAPNFSLGESGFDFANTAKVAIKVEKMTLWIYEGNVNDAAAWQEERGVLAYLAMRILSSAARTQSGSHEPVVRQVVLMKAAETAAENVDATNESPVFEVIQAIQTAPPVKGGAVYSASNKLPLRLDEIAQTLIGSMEMHTTANTRLAIRVSLGSMHLPHLAKESHFDVPEGVEQAFPGSTAHDSRIVSRRRLREGLQNASPEIRLDGEAQLARTRDAVDAMAVASEIRGRIYGGDGRDVCRINYKPEDAQILARTQMHDRMTGYGVGYADKHSMKNRALTCGFATPHVREAWGSMAVYSAESCHRASEALQVAAVAEALRRQQFDEPTDVGDELLRDVLSNGRSDHTEIGFGQANLLLRVADGAQWIRYMKNYSSFPRLVAATVDAFLRTAVVLNLITSSADIRHITSAATATAAIISSPLGEGKEGMLLAFQYLTATFSASQAMSFVRTVFSGVADALLSSKRARPIVKYAGKGRTGLALTLGSHVWSTTRYVARTFGWVPTLIGIGTLAPSGMNWLNSACHGVAPSDIVPASILEFGLSSQPATNGGVQGTDVGIMPQVKMVLETGVQAFAIQIAHSAYAYTIRSGVNMTMDLPLDDWLNAGTRRLEPPTTGDEDSHNPSWASWWQPHPRVAQVANFDRAARLESGVHIIRGRTSLKRIANMMRSLSVTAFGHQFGNQTGFLEESSSSSSTALQYELKGKIQDLIDLGIREPMDNDLGDLGAGGYAAAHAADIVSSIRQSDDTQSQMQGVVRMTWIAALHTRVRNLNWESPERQKLKRMVGDLWPQGTVLNNIFAQNSGAFIDGYVNISPELLETELKSSVGLAYEDGPEVNLFFPGRVRADATAVARQFVRQLYSGMLRDQTLHRVCEDLKDARNTASLWGNDDTHSQAFAAVGATSEDENALPLLQEAFRYYSAMGPGNASPVMGVLGIAVALHALLKELRLFRSLRIGGSYDAVGRYLNFHFVDRFGVGPLLFSTMDVTLRVAITMHSNAWMPEVIKYLTTQGGMGEGEVLTKFIGAYTKLLIDKLATGLYQDEVAPRLRSLAWQTREARELIATNGTRPLIQKVPSVDKTGVGWLTRATVQGTKNDLSASGRNVTAVILTQHAVEMAALLSVGELRQCTDPLNVKEWDRKLCVERLAANGALLNGLKEENVVQVEKLAFETTAVRLNGGMLPRRKPHKKEKASLRFQPILLKRTPRAYGAFAALFGAGSPAFDAVERPRVPLAHATVMDVKAVSATEYTDVNTEIGENLEAVHVTDALRGAVSGALDLLVDEKHWEELSELAKKWPAEQPPKAVAATTQLALRNRLLQHPKRMDFERASLVHQVASAFLTPTLCEFALLVREAVRHAPKDAGFVSVDELSDELPDESVKLAVDTALSPLEESLRRFRASHPAQSLSVVPPAGLALRREGIVEQGRLCILWMHTAAKLPRKKGGHNGAPMDAAQLREGAKHGMTERYLRGKQLVRDQANTPEVDHIVHTLQELWEGFGGGSSDTETALGALGVLQPACVLLDSAHTCLGLDDLLLDPTKNLTDLEELKKQLQLGVALTLELRQALTTPTDEKPKVKDVVKKAVDLHYAPTVRSPYNALLPTSVLGKRANIYSDAHRGFIQS